jgi:hypothetical protein
LTLRAAFLQAVSLQAGSSANRIICAAVAAAAAASAAAAAVAAVVTVSVSAELPAN